MKHLFFVNILQLQPLFLHTRVMLLLLYSILVNEIIYNE